MHMLHLGDTPWEAVLAAYGCSYLQSTAGRLVTRVTVTLHIILVHLQQCELCREGVQSVYMPRTAKSPAVDIMTAQTTT